MRPVRTGVYLYVPARFDPQLFPELHGYENEACWLLDKIVTNAAKFKHDAGFDGLVHISHQTMRGIMQPRAVSVVRQTLKENNVIVINENYLPTRFATRGRKPHSMSYGLGRQYAGGVVPVEITKPALARKVRRGWLSVRKQQVTEADLDRTLAHLLGWLKRTKIDVEASYKIIEGDPHDPILLTQKLGEAGARRLVELATPSKEALNRMVIDTIDRGAWEFSVCEYGRVHTNITRTKSECRACLSIDGQRLASIDVCNSQVVFFLALVLDQPSATRSLDVDLFKNDVEGGVLYNRLMNECEYSDRGLFKGEFFKAVLFGDNTKKYSRESHVARAFRKRYPDVWQYVLQAKRPSRHPKVPRGDAYKMLAREMQLRESSLMIGRVCRHLAEWFPNVPILTIHDSILTPTQHVRLVQRVILEEFVALGLNPKLKTDFPVGDDLPRSTIDHTPVAPARQCA